ncbi:SDR family NAD(P)-dependent oxidoreductase [Frankia sp. R82]|uniref:SDR family NAD(P)-dependent oxidoreductase n=1 Tax=Frankia sp. R82 TaxID=2950553 RepID=UPI0020443081|nr:SDR family NAD(P)-dependent oxidoreductase [Frankia sp. R82]MCM3887356.1 SDR family NAD(P)-dependent oxidoreductase [Frankia sp. R82]
MLGADPDQHLGGLRAIAAGEAAGHVVTGVAAAAPGRVAFLFTGQGSQRPGAGRELYRGFGAFAAALDEVAEHLDAALGRSVRELLFAEPGSAAAADLDATAYTQPALFALEVALFRLAESFGLRADRFIGHSVGELTAAHLAGVLSLPDAAALVAARGRLMQAVPAIGAMAALDGTEAEILALLADARTDAAGDGEAAGDGRPAVDLAAVNGPHSVVISGDADAVDELSRRWRQDGHRARRLRVSHAFHSAHLDPVLDEYRAVLGTLTLHPPTIPIVSNVTGRIATDADLTDPDYWVRHLRGTVRFGDGVRTLADQGVRTFVELGPDAVLAALAEQTLAEQTPTGSAGDAAAGPAATVVALLRANRPETRSVTAALARLHVEGAVAAVDWTAAFGGHPVTPTALPTYPFQRERHWLVAPRPSTGGAARASGGRPADHPLLTETVELADGGLVLTGRLATSALPWLVDHAVGDVVLLPGTAFVDLALAAGRQVDAGRVEELALVAPLVLAGEAAVELQVLVGPAQPAEDGARRTVTLYSRPADADQAATSPPWQRHATGSLRTAATDLPAAAEVPTDADVPTAADDTGVDGVWPPSGAVPVDLTGLYPQLAADGYQYGPAFRGLRAAWRVGEQILAEVELPAAAGDEAGRFVVHPALFDAALHAVVGLLPAAEPTEGRIRLPFAWREVHAAAAGATGLRVLISPTGADTVTLDLADLAGTPLATVGALTLRPVAAQTLLEAGRRAAGTTDPAADSLFRLDWPLLDTDTEAGTDPVAGTAADPGTDGVPGADATVHAELDATDVADLDALRVAVDAGAPAPRIVVHRLSGTTLPGTTLPGDALPGDAAAGGTSALPAVVGAAHATVATALQVLRDWLTDQRFAASRLVIMTEQAIATGPGEDVRDLAAAGVWGLARSARAEHPGRVALLDVDGRAASAPAVARALALLGAPEAEHSELVVRDGEICRPLLAPVRDSSVLVPPDGVDAWRLDVTTAGSLDDLALLPEPAAHRPLEPLEVRVALRAAGLNFRDVLIGLGMYPGGARIGAEGAGVVVEVGAEVHDLAPGDRVMGLVQGTLGPLAVTDRRLLTAVPPGWSFSQAAGTPVAFLTAYHGLVGLAGLGADEAVLIHAATGGVGQAAVQLARARGAEVFGTASPAKWPVLRAGGLDDAHISSSRELTFADAVRTTTGGRGVDVVLNALAGEFTDASLRLLAPGGRFVEMGKTDPRDPATVAADHPGRTYQSFDLFDVAAERIAAMLADLAGLFASGALRPLPTASWDIRHAGTALRQLSLARHTGKLVLTLPAPLDPAGTVLVTGATGALGALTAHRLVTRHGIRHLLLASRRGPDAPGADALHAQLTEAGAAVTVVAADVSNPDDVRRLLAAVPEQHPLTAVVHTGGVLADTVVTSLEPDALHTVLAPKVDGAWLLHQATADLDLAAFVLFSSVTGLLGTAGQANYTAANTFLDALAHHRRAAGRPAVSLAWGHWAEAGGLAGQLTATDQARMARAGIAPMSNADGLALFDQALTVTSGDAPAAGAEALLVPARLNPPAAGATAGSPNPVWDGLRRSAPRGSAGTGQGGASGIGATATTGPAAPADQAVGVVERLRDRPAQEQYRGLLTLVRTTAAEILGHASPAAIRPDRGFLESAFDSLSAIELRNRLNRQTGVHLPTTLLFDHPTPALLATHLRDTLFPPAPEPDVAAPTASPMAQAPVVGETPTVPTESAAAAAADDSTAFHEQISDADDDEFFELLDRELGLA